MQRRVLITTLPSILNVVRLVKFRNAPIKTIHFISFCFAFFVSHFVEKKQQQQQNRHGKEKLSCLCRFFFNVSLADYNKLRQGSVNKSKYKMGKKIYVYSFTYPRSAHCIKICRTKNRWKE